MQRIILFVIVLLLAGCFTSGKRGTEKGLVVYDLGPPMPALVAERATPLAVEVRAPLWMDTLGINYRLAYGDPARLNEYALARWAGPPSQLIQQRLAQRMALSTAGQGRSKCVLRIEIVEFSQIFSGPEESRAVLQGRALWLDSSRRQLAELNLDIQQNVFEQNSAGGITALRAAVDRLGQDLQAWEGALQATGKTAACAA